MDEDLVNYHLKELHCSAQCLIKDEDLPWDRGLLIYSVLGISLESHGSYKT